MKYLTTEQVNTLHDELIKRHGGLAGVRDMGLLRSALDVPNTTLFGQEMYPTVYDKASAYLYHLVCNHPFNDANKRSGAAVVLVFLEVNKAEIRFYDDELEYLVVEVAKGTIPKEEILCWIRKEPGKETLQAMKESEEGLGIECDSIEDFWKKMGVDRG